MTETLKLLIALYYFYKPMGVSSKIIDIHEKQIWEYIKKNHPDPSHEQLSAVFKRSKASTYRWKPASSLGNILLKKRRKS